MYFEDSRESNWIFYSQHKFVSSFSSAFFFSSLHYILILFTVSLLWRRQYVFDSISELNLLLLVFVAILSSFDSNGDASSRSIWLVISIITWLFGNFFFFTTLLLIFLLFCLLFVRLAFFWSRFDLFSLFATFRLFNSTFDFCVIHKCAHVTNGNKLAFAEYFFFDIINVRCSWAQFYRCLCSLGVANVIGFNGLACVFFFIAQWMRFNTTKWRYYLPYCD